MVQFEIERRRRCRVDEEIKRRVLRKLPYGMYVMTAAGPDGNPTGSTLTWISQCSFKPPLVMLAIQKTSLMHGAVEASGALAVNLLAEDQAEIAQAFFRPPPHREGRLGELAYEPGPATGSPILEGLPAWLEARVTDAVARGDHTVFVAEVVGAGLRDPERRPLLLSSTPWNYGG
jgi:flavin reductase (DIM6/NTAB) family NADH-FMN oxidoreductase RutF